MVMMALTKDNFDQVVATNEIVVLDFWAPWCGPCRSFEPIFEEVAAQYPDVVFGKINTEDETELAADFAIRSIPNVMVLRQNVVLFSQGGVLPASALSDLIDQAKAIDMADVYKNLGDES